MDDELLRWNFWSHLRFLRLPPVQTYASFSPLPTVLRVCCCASSWKYRVFGFGYGIDTRGSSNLQEEFRNMKMLNLSSLV